MNAMSRSQCRDTGGAGMSLSSAVPAFAPEDDAHPCVGDNSRRAPGPRCRGLIQKKQGQEEGDPRRSARRS